MVGNWNMGLVFDESGTDGVECRKVVNRKKVERTIRSLELSELI